MLDIDKQTTVEHSIYLRSKYGHSRTGECGCGWSYKSHGNTCPEHGSPALQIDRKNPIMLQQTIFITANEISKDSWLRKDSRFEWFVNGYDYASTQDRAIPALANCSPEDLYFAVCAIMLANKIPIPDEE